MEATFRLSPDHSIQISSEQVDNSVCIRNYEGVDFDQPLHERPHSTVRLTKAQARALASAMMGCAAEL